MRRNGRRVRILLAVALLAAGCNTSRGVDEVRALRDADAKFVIVAPCTVAAAQSAVEPAAKALELDVEQASSRPGDPWVLMRGRRLTEPQLWFRVDVTPTPDPSAAAVRVFAVPVPRILTDTGETVAKPSLLAMRVVAACAGGAP